MESQANIRPLGCGGFGCVYDNPKNLKQVIKKPKIDSEDLLGILEVINKKAILRNVKSMIIPSYLESTLEKIKTIADMDDANQIKLNQIKSLHNSPNSFNVIERDISTEINMQYQNNSEKMFDIKTQLQKGLSFNEEINSILEDSGQDIFLKVYQLQRCLTRYGMNDIENGGLMNPIDMRSFYVLSSFLTEKKMNNTIFKLFQKYGIDNYCLLIENELPKEDSFLEKDFDIIMEKCNGGSIGQYITTLSDPLALDHNDKVISNAKKVQLFSKMFSLSYICFYNVLKVLHETSLCHNDIKCDNMMLCENTVKVIDFGMVSNITNFPISGTDGYTYIGNTKSYNADISSGAIESCKEFYTFLMVNPSFPQTWVDYWKHHDKTIDRRNNQDTNKKNNRN